MKLGIDISQIAYPGTGVARFTEGLVNAILDFDKQNSWTFIFATLRGRLDKNMEDKISKSNHKLLKLPIAQSVSSFFCYNLRGLTNQITGSMESLKQLDWFITSDWLEYPMPVKKATTVHDLVFQKYPGTVHPRILNIQKKRLNFVAKESKIIFVDSDSTKKDLLDIYKINASSIMVNFPGVDVSTTSDDIDKATLKKYRLSSPYILTVGKLEPRKNISSLIQAFNKISGDFPDLELVIVGRSGWGKEIKESKNIRLMGYVEDKELVSINKNAQIFAYPSLYEGFGYPIIEAMKCGCPVITSNTSSMLEIAGEAALFFDPISVDSIAESINKLLTDSNLRTKLIQKGRDRARLFSWKTYYNKLVNALTR